MPLSSMHITAGSVFLLLTKGAMALTAMPAEPTKIMQSAFLKDSPAALYMFSSRNLTNLAEFIYF